MLVILKCYLQRQTFRLYNGYILHIVLKYSLNSLHCALLCSLRTTTLTREVLWLVCSNIHDDSQVSSCRPRTPPPPTFLPHTHTHIFICHIDPLTHKYIHTLVHIHNHIDVTYTPVRTVFFGPLTW